MARVSRLCPNPAVPLTAVATARVLYADTDKMGIVYHGAYLRYLEMARVEFMRARGLPYNVLEDDGLALPVTELVTRYVSPGLYDDTMTLEVGLSLVTGARVHFDYRVRVNAGDRRGLASDIDLLIAQTRHACTRVATGRPCPLPDAVRALWREA